MSKCRDILDECKQQVTVTIRNNLQAIIQFLWNKKIVCREFYQKVTDPNSRYRYTEDDVAKLVFRELYKKVEEDDDNYDIFYKYIAENTDFKAEKTERMLREKYCEMVPGI